MPRPRITTADTADVSNLVPAFVDLIPVRALVDTGAAKTILSANIHSKILTTRASGTKRSRINKRKRHETFYSANSTPINVLADFDSEIKIGGLTVPMTLAVVDKLGYDLILGMDFFARDARDDRHGIKPARTF